MERGGVLLAISTFEVGGTERQTVRLAVELHHRGIPVGVLAMRASGPLGADLARAGVPVHEIGLDVLRVRRPDGSTDLVSTARRVLPAFGRILRLLRRLRPQIVVANLFLTYAIVLPLAVLARVPVRIAGRRNLATGTEGLAPPVHRLLAALADRSATLHLCNAQAVADVVRGEGVADDRIHVIPNGLDLPAAADDVARQPARGVVLANLIHYKGHQDLLHALATLQAPPEIDCWGEGPERDRLKALAAELGLADVVAFPGRTTDAASTLAAYQFAVHPSHEEGLPNAVLEELAVGLPVVATTVGGVPELVSDGVEGLLVPPHAPSELGTAIHSVASDPGLRTRLGSAGRRRARDFTWPACTDRHVELFAYRASAR